MDESLSVLREGYGWLPNRRRRTGRDVVRTRVLGQRAVGLCGPEAARFFYDEGNTRRHGALPGPVISTLFGHGAVHTLDGDAHRGRKDLFLSLVTEDTIADLVASVGEAWDEVAASWPAGRPVVLFDEAARVLTLGVCRWAGVDVDDGMARDLVAMVDGFATAGPRHCRARRARQRREASLGKLVDQVRAGAVEPVKGSAVDVVARHRDAGGELLSPRVAAVELLNVIRPTVAVCWFVAHAGHALHRWPEHRESLRSGGAAFAEAYAHELRRFYPFAPFIGARAVRDLTWQGSRSQPGRWCCSTSTARTTTVACGLIRTCSTPTGSSTGASVRTSWSPRVPATRTPATGARVSRSPWRCCVRWRSGSPGSTTTSPSRTWRSHSGGSRPNCAVVSFSSRMGRVPPGSPRP
ncbi:hypothetical protein GCM10029964_078860 [Kibdelosporangium lantanae]